LSKFFQKKEPAAGVDNLSIHNTTVTGASTSANLGGFLRNKKIVLPSFGVFPYDYFSSTLTMDLAAVRLLNAIILD
jgi:hypothetical protein